MNPNNDMNLETSNKLCTSCKEGTPDNACLARLSLHFNILSKHIEDQILKFPDVDSYYLTLAKSQVGKSYLLNLLSDQKLKLIPHPIKDDDKKALVVNGDLNDPAIIRIGTGNESMTFKPNFKNLDVNGKKVCFIDLPGMDDSFIQNKFCSYNKRVLCTWIVNTAVKLFANIKIIILIDYKSLGDINIDNSWKILETICDKFGTTSLENKIGLFISKSRTDEPDQIVQSFESIGKKQTVENGEGIAKFLGKRTFCLLKQAKLKNIKSPDDFFTTEKAKAFECIERITEHSRFEPGKKFDLDPTTLVRIVNIVETNIENMTKMVGIITDMADKVIKNQKDFANNVQQSIFVILGALIQNAFPVIVSSFLPKTQGELVSCNSQLKTDRANLFGDAVVKEFSSFVGKDQTKNETEDMINTIRSCVGLLKSTINTYSSFIVIRDSIEGNEDAKRIFPKFGLIICGLLNGIEKIQNHLDQKLGVKYNFLEVCLKFVCKIPQNKWTELGFQTAKVGGIVLATGLLALAGTGIASACHITGFSFGVSAMIGMSSTLLIGTGVGICLIAGALLIFGIFRYIKDSQYNKFQEKLTDSLKRLNDAAKDILPKNDLLNISEDMQEMIKQQVKECTDITEEKKTEFLKLLEKKEKIN